jgi:DNA-binding response OmpR family regulator
MNRHGIVASASWASADPSQQPDERPQTIQRILVVEDDPTLAALEVEVLTAHGYTVVTVHSGELAITTLRNLIPDLVVLDLELTGNVNGWEVLQELRTIAHIPVLITSSSVAAVRTYMRDSGETRCTLDHLPKPYPMQTLLKRVKRMLPMTS